jgi:hypothetical protein
MSIYANWIVPARERVQTNTVMNFRIPYKAGDILTSWVTASFSERTRLFAICLVICLHFRPCRLQLVTVNFWVLNSLLDPALIEDTQVLQDHVPCWMNHSLHTNVLVFTLAELFLSYRSFPRWAALGRMRSTVVVLAYTSWCVTIHISRAHAQNSKQAWRMPCNNLNTNSEYPT